MDIIRVKLVFKINRQNITYEVLNILKEYDIEIISMEVYTNVIYLKLPKIGSVTLRKLEESWSSIEGFDHLENIDVMSFEKKDVELAKVLDFIKEGVIMLSSEGKVDYINTASKKYLSGIKEGDLILDYIRSEELVEFFESSKNTIKNKVFIFDNKTFLINIDKLFSEKEYFCGYFLTVNELDMSLYSSTSYITFNDIIGSSPQIEKAIRMSKLFSDSDTSILLLGESGTGKEMFARAIHSYSRIDKKFIGINCAAIPEELLESELFGYEPGTFTGGSDKGKIGIFEACRGGTVFLDEIGELNYHLQAKILRAIQERKIRRLGSNKEMDIDVRIISATNRDILKLIDEGKFRLDLYYRLNTFTVKIPALRDRKGDFEILTKYFLEKMKERYKKYNLIIDDDAKRILRSYSYPGNIRELQNVIERSVVLSNNGRITKEEILFDYHEKDNMLIDYNISLKEAVENFEKDYIIKALKNSRSIRDTAKKLNTTHTLLINRIKKYSINIGEEKYDK